MQEHFPLITAVLVDKWRCAFPASELTHYFNLVLTLQLKHKAIFFRHTKYKTVSTGIRKGRFLHILSNTTLEWQLFCSESSANILGGDDLSSVSSLSALFPLTEKTPSALNTHPSLHLILYSDFYTYKTRTVRHFNSYFFSFT